MKKTIGYWDFINGFEDANRIQSFSRAGFDRLFSFFEDLEGDTGEEIEFDPIAIDYEFTEYEDLEEIQADYPGIESMEDLNDETIVLTFDGGIIIKSF